MPRGTVALFHWATLGRPIQHWPYLSGGWPIWQTRKQGMGSDGHWAVGALNPRQDGDEVGGADGESEPEEYGTRLRWQGGKRLTTVTCL
jgi:hypothetical protein